MELAQLAALLKRLSTYLRPDLAKAIEACADAILVSHNHSEAAEKLFASYRTKKQRETLQRTADLFALLASLQVGQHDLQALALMLAEPPVKPEVKKASPPRKAADPNPEIAEQLVSELASAVLDRDRFPKIHQQLKNGKCINTPTLHLIARNFLDTGQRYSGRKQALDAILRRHYDALRVAEQDQVLDRLNEGR